MAKTLFYRLFGVGKIPEQFMATLKAEGIHAFDEGIKGSVTYRNFHAPGKYFSWRRQWFTGSVVLTQVRLIALRSSNPIINVPFTDERIRSLRLSIEGQDTFLVAFDPSLFHPDWSGTIEYRFRTTQAVAFLEKLRERIA